MHNPQNEARQTIKADSARCAGCMNCMLSCSFWHGGSFRLSASRLTVKRLINRDHEFEVNFLPECDGCGICARYCTYGALAAEKQ